MRMSRRDFYEMRLGEFLEALRMYDQSVVDDRRHIGELVRGAAFRLWDLQVRKQDKIRDIRKFWAMPWDELDEDSEVERLTHLTDDDRKVEVEKAIKKLGWQDRYGKQSTESKD